MLLNLERADAVSLAKSAINSILLITRRGQVIDAEYNQKDHSTNNRIKPEIRPEEME